MNRLLGTYNEDRVVVGYARVSSHTQKDDLDRQVKLIRRYAFEYGYGDMVVLRDVGSGLNEDRRGFRRLLKMIVDNIVSKVIVAYPDRLIRFGFKTLEYFFKIHGAVIISMSQLSHP